MWVRRDLGGWARARVWDGAARAGLEQIDAVDSILFGCRREAGDQGVQVRAAGAGGGVLEVGGDVLVCDWDG